MLFHSVSILHVASMVGRCDCIHWEEGRPVCWNTLQSSCMSATCTALVWDSPFVAIDGPSFIESFDFCVSSALVWDGPSVEGPSLIQSFDFCVSDKLSSTI